MRTLTHGTRYAYVFHRCHCERCRAANLDYQKRWRDRQRAKGRRMLHGRFIPAPPADRV